MIVGLALYEDGTAGLFALSEDMEPLADEVEWAIDEENLYLGEDTYVWQYTLRRLSEYKKPEVKTVCSDLWFGMVSIPAVPHRDRNADFCILMKAKTMV